jgi:YD repeat-containing protein
MTQADGTVASVRYDAFDNVIEAVDPNGTRVVSGYDKLHRLTRNSVAPGPGVSGDTTFEEFAHDGLSRLVRAADDDSNVLFAYDPLSRVVRESLNGLETAYSHDAAGNVLSIRGPGGHTTRYEYDALRRPVACRAGDLAGQPFAILRAAFAGRSRLAELTYGHGVQSSFAYDALLRPSRSTHAAADAGGGLAPFDDRAYEHDGAYRKISRRSRLPGGLQQTYAYDSADRLVGSTFGVEGAPPTSIVYLLDAAGLRQQVDGGPDAGAYVLDATLPEPADRQMSQYTTTPQGGRQYDANGNLKALVSGDRATRSLEYDFAGRLVAVSDLPTDTTAHYRYDALGRRHAHEVAKGIISNIRAIVFAGANVVEERDENGLPLAFIDHAAEGLPVRRAYGPDADGDFVPDLICFYHTDDAGNVTAVTDAQGQVIERYEYGDYGRPRILDARGNPLQESAIGNPFLLGGSWYDAETGYFVVGNDAPEIDFEGRHYDPRIGDTISQRFAFWPHMHQHGTHRQGASMGAPKKSFAQKLGGFAKGVAQVGLGVAGGSQGRKMMGNPKIGEATAGFNSSQADEWSDWVETVWNKQCVEKDTSVSLADQDYNIKRRIDMAACGITGNEWPELKRGALGQKAKAWMVNNYEVHPVFGLKTEWITSIGLPKITPKIAKESHGKFRMPATGSDQFHTATPGHKYVDTLTLRGPMTAGRKALCTWITEVVQGKPWKRTWTITELLSVDGSVKDRRAAVWKEFSPAEEQLKGNPRH